MTKGEWRTRLLAARRALPPETRAREAVALTRHAMGLVAKGSTVCAYVPVGTEPGSVALLDALRGRSARVLLPVAREPAALRWADYTGADGLVAAPHGLREPGGRALAPSVVTEADVVLLPALGVDRTGVRLGRGAGFYDRTLPLARPDARLVAVVRDEEVVDALPADPHDTPVGWALTPAGLHRLG